MSGDWEKALEFFKEQHRLTIHPFKRTYDCRCSIRNAGQKENAMELHQKN
jgi:hypothetical protein